MTGVDEIGDYRRIEDFIALVKKGAKVDLKIELKKRLVTEKVSPDVTADRKDEMDMYLLIADYIFKVEKDMKIVPKVYMVGSSEEPLDIIKVNSNIANARLTMDYQRLKDANIKFEEKYF